MNEEETVRQCLAAIEASASELNELMSILENSLVTDRAKEIFDPLVVMHEELAVSRQQAVDFIQARDQEELSRWLKTAISDTEKFHAAAQELGDLAESLVAEVKISAFQEVINLVAVSCFIGAAAILTAVAVTRRLNRRISLPLIDMARAAEKIAVGDMDIHLDSLGGDEIGQLSEAFHKMIQAMQEQIRVLEAASNGDLTVTVEPRSANDCLNQSLAVMLKTNSNMVRQIQCTASQVMAGAVEISKMAQVLASSSMEQAASVEQFSSALDDIYYKTKTHMENAEWALSTSNQTQELADSSLDNMRRSQQAIENIEKGANNIAVVTQAINDIAFQTNILSLNAAVEAAHAGPHGRGFAVVADEVRMLALKSAAAAQETAGLINSSIESVKQGRESIELTGAGLLEMQRCSLKSLQMIQDIAGSSVEQKNTMDEISSSIQQIVKVISDVSVHAEETAAASEKLSAQSQVLDELVSEFKVTGTIPQQNAGEGANKGNSSMSREAYSL